MDDLSTAMPETVFQGAVALLRELTAISSPSGDAEGLERMAERLAGELGGRGLRTEIRAEPSAEAGRALPVLLACGPDTSRGHLLLIGHLDTVLAAAPSRLEGDRLVATGAIDMKGGLVTLAGALDLLRHRGQAPPADLLLVAVPDEEVGGELSRSAIRRWGESARALWVLEPGEPAGASETMVAGRRGMSSGAWRRGALPRTRVCTTGRAARRSSPPPAGWRRRRRSRRGTADRPSTPAASSAATRASWTVWRRTTPSWAPSANSTSCRIEPWPKARCASSASRIAAKPCSGSWIWPRR